jgi:hypothetical protein
LTAARTRPELLWRTDINTRIMLFNFYYSGHYPHHLERLLRDWALRGPTGELLLVIAEGITQRKPDFPP